MDVERVPLPGAATVVVVQPRRRVLIDCGLSRDEATLALTGVLPHVHPDVIDHWLDTAYERRRLPFTARQAITSVLLAATLGFMLHIPAHSVQRVKRPNIAVRPAGVDAAGRYVM